MPQEITVQPAEEKEGEVKTEDEETESEGEANEEEEVEEEEAAEAGGTSPQEPAKTEETHETPAAATAPDGPDGSFLHYLPLFFHVLLLQWTLTFTLMISPVGFDWYLSHLRPVEDGCIPRRVCFV